MDQPEIAQRCTRRLYETDHASRTLGITIDVIGPGAVTATMTVTRSMLNGFAVCHGGIIFTLADTAFAFACNAYDNLTLAAGASIEFLRPAREGDVLTAVASEVHRGGRSGVYDVLVRNREDEAIAVFRGRSHSTGRSVLAAKSDT